MKKYYFTLLVLALMVSACSKKKGAPPADDGFNLEGTVVKVWDWLVPSAQATNFAILLSGNDDKCEQAAPERCAYLVDVTGPGEDSVIDAVPVIGGKFNFRLGRRPPPAQILKVIVRGWDPVSKKPIEGSAHNREIAFKGVEVSGSLEVTPASTLLSRRRVEVLKSNRLPTPAEQMAYLNRIYELTKQPDESVNETFARMMDSITVDNYQDFDELLDRLSAGDGDESLKPALDAIFVQNLHLDLAKLSALLEAELSDLLDEINDIIRGSFLGQSHLFADEDSQGLDISAEEYFGARRLHSDLSLELADRQAALAEAQSPEAAALLQQEIQELEAAVVEAEHEEQQQSEALRPGCGKFFEYLRLNQVRRDLEETKLLINLAEAPFAEMSVEIQEKVAPIAAPEDFMFYKFRSLPEACCYARDRSRPHKTSDRFCGTTDHF